MQVALFVPCYVDQLYPRVALATAELLERFGCEVIVPERQTCCGQPLANSGFFEGAAPLAQHHLQAFDGFEHVVCPSGSCTAMVRHQFERLLPGDPKAHAAQERTYELCEFLHDVLKVQPEGRFARKVALHQSCHGLRELRLGVGSERKLEPFDKVRAALGKLDGLELVALQRQDECCGFGGTFSVVEEAVSCAMGRDRLDDHAKAGAEVITGTDVSCLMHLDGLIRRDGRPQRVLHIAELLAEAAR
jgi:L-lactate dehydrogenase complex protein LldE